MGIPPTRKPTKTTTHLTEDEAMSGKYSAIINDDKLKLFGGWSVIVKCNDLDTFNELCEHIRAFKQE